VHDFAYADLGYDGYEPPSILQVPGATDVAVELYTLTKSFSMAGWRMGFLVGNEDVVAALGKLKSYLHYRPFHPLQIPSLVPPTLHRAAPWPGGGATRSSTGWPGAGGRSNDRAARFSSGRRSPSRTRRWEASSSPRCSCPRRRSPSHPASASAPAARASCASRSSRTSSASARPSAASAAR